MKLNNIDLFQLLPQFMQDDKNSQAFVYAIQDQMNKVSENIVHAKIYSRVGEMDDELLDELAWQFNVPEYDASYSIETKRTLIKNSLITHHKRGTAGVVEQIVKDIYGDAVLEEWFDYNGSPYHFKVRTTNTEATDEMLADLDRIIKETQNIRSYLEEVIVELMERSKLYIGCKAIIMDEVELKTIDIG